MLAELANWDLWAKLGITMAGTLVGVFLAFLIEERRERRRRLLAERAEYRRRLEDTLYSPLVELMDSFTEQLQGWERVPVARLEDLARSARAAGLLKMQLSQEIAFTETSLELYNEHCLYFDRAVKRILSAELGDLTSLRDVLETELSARLGEVSTVEDFLLRPNSYDRRPPAGHWLTAVAAVMVGTKHASSIGTQIAPGTSVTSGGTVVTWNDIDFILDPAIEGAARKAFDKIRTHATFTILEIARKKATEQVTGILKAVRDRRKQADPAGRTE